MGQENYQRMEESLALTHTSISPIIMNIWRKGTNSVITSFEKKKTCEIMYSFGRESFRNRKNGLKSDEPLEKCSTPISPLID